MTLFQLSLVIIKLMLKKYNLIFFLIFFFSNWIKADEINFFKKIRGCFCTGGLIVGKVDRSDKIVIDGKSIKISEDGFFVFGFDRNYQNSVNFSVNGQKYTRNIEKKKYKVERINNLPKRKVEPSKDDLDQIIKDQKKIKLAKKNSINRKIFSNKFRLPVEGRISGVYGSQRILNKIPKRPHYGLDIAAPKGKKIFAPNNGVVTMSAKNMFFTGNTVILDHGLGLISIFAHLEDIFVEVGEAVEVGKLIASVGMTGRATGPHLHWGMYLSNIPIDPMLVVEANLF